MIEVKLTPREVRACISVAADRLTASTEAGLNHATTYHRSLLVRMSQEIVGTCGEMAFAKARGMFWSPSVNTFHKSPDITGRGKDIEIRSTERDNGCLFVRANDDPKRWYILVTGEPPVMKVRGYILGERAMVEEFYWEPEGQRPTWKVPQAALTGFEPYQKVG